jgi:hypothetical protein
MFFFFFYTRAVPSNGFSLFAYRQWSLFANRIVRAHYRIEICAARAPTVDPF